MNKEIIKLKKRIGALEKKEEESLVNFCMLLFVTIIVSPLIMLVGLGNGLVAFYITFKSFWKQVGYNKNNKIIIKLKYNKMEKKDE